MASLCSDQLRRSRLPLATPTSNSSTPRSLGSDVWDAIATMTSPQFRVVGKATAGMVPNLLAEWPRHTGARTPGRGGPPNIVEAPALHFDSGGWVDVRALVDRIDVATGMNDRVRIHMLMAIVCCPPPARSHTGFKVSPSNPPEFAGIRATQGDSLAFFPQEERFAIPQPPALFLRTTTMVLWHGTRRDNARSNTDNGLIPGSPQQGQTQRCPHLPCPCMPWDKDYKANFLQRAAAFFGIDPPPSSCRPTAPTTALPRQPTAQSWCAITPR